jgi:hypothetical protein
MSALLSWLKPYEWIVWIVCLVLIVGSVWGYGHYEYRQGVASVQIANLKTDLKVTMDSAAVTQKSFTVDVPKIQYIQTQGQTITKQVPVYIHEKDDAACPIPAGFGSLLDAAAQGTPLPNSPSTSQGVAATPASASSR